MYQIAPVAFDSLASDAYYNKDQSWKKYEKLAIKTALIPWQKGCYYLNMGNFSSYDKDIARAIIYYDKAYTYINSYKYPCWGFAYLDYYYAGQYDKAIEMSKDFTHPESGKITPLYGIISRCYMMKGDIKKAQFYIAKALETESTPYNMALKAFIEKKTGNINTANEFYKKALAKSTEYKYITEEDIKEIYADWYAYEAKKK